MSRSSRVPGPGGAFRRRYRYAQRIEGQRPDLQVIDDRTRLDDNLGDVTDVIDANLGRRTVQLVRIDRFELGRPDRPHASVRAA